MCDDENLTLPSAPSPGNSVMRHLAALGRAHAVSLFTALSLVLVTSLLDTAVISLLLTALLVLVIGGAALSPSDSALTFFGHDWTARLLRMLDGTEHGQLLVSVSLLLIAVILVKCSLEITQNYLMSRFTNLLGRDLRQRIFDKLIDLPPSYFEKNRSGAHLSRITGDVMVIQSCLGQQLLELVRAPFTILFALAAMILLSWQQVLASLCLVPLIIMFISAIGKKIRFLSEAIQDRFADLNTRLVERLANLQVIHAFARETYEIEQVTTLNQRYYRDAMRLIRLAELLPPSVEFIAMVGMVTGIVLGGVAVFHGSLAPASFLLFLVLAQRASAQFKPISRINQLRQQVTGAGSGIVELLETHAEIEDAPQAGTLPALSGHVVFEQVSFHYSDHAEVLSDISFSAAPGEVIALVGASGVGKSTLLNLLPRFYDPTAGRILLDGHDIRQVTLASLRGQVGLVPQNPLLFNCSIMENILFGRLDASEDEVRCAAQTANALNFIEMLPNGFDTIVGERGTALSGGQRQRVAIARAVLKNPRILLLDEATSALDSESELLVQAALEVLMQGRTSFVIAHRLTTVEHATRILVFDRGRIVESGSHGELLDQCGTYRRLYEMQRNHHDSP